jgi:hypothetical protein
LSWSARSRKLWRFARPEPDRSEWARFMAGHRTALILAIRRSRSRASISAARRSSSGPAPVRTLGCKASRATLCGLAGRGKPDRPCPPVRVTRSGLPGRYG